MRRLYDRDNVWSVNYRRLTSGWLLLAYLAGLLTATHVPYEFRTGEVCGIGLDRFIHGLVYAPAAVLVIGFLAQRPAISPWRRWRFLIAPALLLALSAADEWTQPLVGRDCSLTDWIGDLAGIAMGTAIAAIGERVQHMSSVHTLRDD